MVTRDTGTGFVLENMIIPALTWSNYIVKSQVFIGTKPDGRRYKADVLAYNPTNAEQLLISLKWQQVSGTAEQKVPFEVIVLSKIIKETAEINKAYLVLGGEGWSLREFYTSGGLYEYLKYPDQVVILTLEGFIARANRNEL